MTPPTPAIVPAGSLNAPELIGLFNRAYADYFVHIQLDEAAWSGLVSRFDVNLEASRVAPEGGIVLLGIRGERAWVGGMGVVPEARRTGLGRRLMHSLLEQARARAVRVVQLEVLEQNAPAIALYEALGFVRTRQLDVWALEQPLDAPGATEVDAEDALAWIDAHRIAPEPWQRETTSVRRFASALQPLRGLEVREGGKRTGAAVAIASSARAAILQLEVTGTHAADAARALLAATRAWAPVVRYLNVPSDHVAATVLRDAGAALEARQHEMAVTLHA